MNAVEILLIALLLDAILGEPKLLWSRVPHPAVVMGRAVSGLDRVLNTAPGRMAKGVLTIFLLVLGAGAIGLGIVTAQKAIAANLPPATQGWLPDFGYIEAAFVTILLSHRSLVDHVRAVRRGLNASVEDGRAAVGMIVGRDTAAMNESDVARAAIESAAENFSDGVVAPAFWYLLFGLPGILVYKVVNTADSMIGHLNDRYALFGWGSARLDDLMNWIPARITGGIFCTIGMTRGAWELMREEAQFHRSPNAGWPEAAMAASLRVALAGPRSYDGKLSGDMYINGGARRDLVANDIRGAVGMLWRGWIAIIVVLALIALILMIA